MAPRRLSDSWNALWCGIDALLRVSYTEWQDCSTVFDSMQIAFINYLSGCLLMRTDDCGPKKSLIKQVCFWWLLQFGISLSFVRMCVWVCDCVCEAHWAREWLGEIILIHYHSYYIAVSPYFWHIGYFSKHLYNGWELRCSHLTLSVFKRKKSQLIKLLQEKQWFMN